LNVRSIASEKELAMKRLVHQICAGLVSAFVALSAWAAGSPDSRTILVAPQLAVAGNGPVTATFVTANPVLFSGEWGFSLAALTETPVAVYPLFDADNVPVPAGTQWQTPALLSGTNITLANVTSQTGSPFVSSTGSISVAQNHYFWPGRDADGVCQESVCFPLFLDARVLRIGADSVRIDFPMPAGSPLGLRILVSNVCVK
jgi:hypothetical protein